ncbi:uncharacterized protein LOC110974699 isoform X2 [Acanthaster planci]|uniref:Uncharacterized protein LOC110974699 isoform X2 n=1 Tax=Acanthaster planci TaxID=133434 RepID=A0A8B7XQ82_ACAPL|nr:uncharacterized protein LOC110974699 isoform X2 [Acanthaster planci]
MCAIVSYKLTGVYRAAQRRLVCCESSVIVKPWIIGLTALGRLVARGCLAGGSNLFTMSFSKEKHPLKAKLNRCFKKLKLPFRKSKKDNIQTCTDTHTYVEFFERDYSDCVEAYLNCRQKMSVVYKLENPEAVQVGLFESKEIEFQDVVTLTSDLVVGESLTALSDTNQHFQRSIRFGIAENELSLDDSKMAGCVQEEGSIAKTCLGEDEKLSEGDFRMDGECSQREVGVGEVKDDWYLPDCSMSTLYQEPNQVLMFSSWWLMSVCLSSKMVISVSWIEVWSGFLEATAHMETGTQGSIWKTVESSKEKVLTAWAGNSTAVASNLRSLSEGESQDTRPKSVLPWKVLSTSLEHSSQEPQQSLTRAMSPVLPDSIPPPVFSGQKAGSQGREKNSKMTSRGPKKTAQRKSKKHEAWEKMKKHPVQPEGGCSSNQTSKGQQKGQTGGTKRTSNSAERVTCNSRSGFSNVGRTGASGGTGGGEPPEDKRMRKDKLLPQDKLDDKEEEKVPLTKKNLVRMGNFLRDDPDASHTGLFLQTATEQAVENQPSTVSHPGRKACGLRRNRPPSDSGNSFLQALAKFSTASKTSSPRSTVTRTKFGAYNARDMYQRPASSFSTGSKSPLCYASDTPIFDESGEFISYSCPERRHNNATSRPEALRGMVPFSAVSDITSQTDPETPASQEIPAGHSHGPPWQASASQESQLTMSDVDYFSLLKEDLLRAAHLQEDPEKMSELMLLALSLPEKDDTSPGGD